MADEDQKREEIERGPKGARKHRPGRGHRTKSEAAQKERIARRLRKKHRERKEVARKQKEAWDRLSKEQQKLLRPEDMKTQEGET